VLEVIEPRTGRVLASFLLEPPQVDQAYQRFSFTIEAPPEAAGDGVQLRVVTTNDTGIIFLSDIGITPSQPTELQLNLDLPWSGDYDLVVTHNVTGSGGLSLDGIDLPLISSPQGARSAFASNSTVSGSHELNFTSDLV
jgi:hypothetical protein